MSRLTPVAPRERLVTLDVLRGFALCGVMIGNMLLYSGQWADGPAPGATGLDEIADWFLTIFVRSKAQTLLTLLFGFGFAVQLLRAEERGQPVMGLYVRRLVVLFAFGALHVGGLWWGDVTWTYAVSGFGLLLFLRASNRTRVVWALALVFLPNVVMAIPELRTAAIPSFLEPPAFRVHTARMGLALHRSDHAGLAWEHLRYAFMFCSRIWFWYFPWTLGRFLLGYVAGKRRWFDRDGGDHLPVFRRFAAWGGVVAVATTSLFVLQGPLHVVPRLHEHGAWGQLATATLHEISLLALTLAYVGVVVLLMQRAPWRRVLGVLAPAGRMPLTTYFSQSLICTFIFYGWGLGWAGSVGIAGCLRLAVAIFIAQVALCHVWLRFFRFGPLEWVWRTAVYLKPQPMRA
ncbi:MAG TPA: DUF418 domain-containing protein [Kofleriaceae bacterium]|nr:DUF418 domain-containing protein [Kofleriaceae bacterium]